MKSFCGLLALVMVSSMTALALPTPRAFIGNSGQWPAHVLYGAHTADGFVWITTTGMILDHRAKNAEGTIGADRITLDVVNTRGSFRTSATRNSTTPVVTVHRPGASTHPVNASTVVVHDVRPGIDLEYVWDGDHVRFNILADAGVRVPDPLFTVDGAPSVRTTGSAFELATSLGTVTMTGVLAFQNTVQQSVPVWCTATDRAIGFRVEGATSASPLTIDPIVYATSFHGSADEVITSMALDRNGNVVVGGWTTSPTIDGIAGGTNSRPDAFIACLTPDLKTVLAWSYLGGDSADAVRGVAVGPDGHIWVTGETTSTDMPFPASAISGSFSGVMDGFVVSMSPDLATLVTGMYIAGNGVDLPTGISVSSQGGVAVCGRTTSTAGMPTGPGYSSTALGQEDAFVLALSPNGSQVKAFTYFGSPGNDAFLCVSHDAQSNIVVGGFTTSNEYKTWPEKTLIWVPGDDERGEAGYYKEVGSNPFDVDYNGGATDGVLAKFANDGELIFSTYFGGAGDDQVNDVFTNSDNDVFGVGTTTSQDLPVPQGSNLAYRGLADAFYTAISKDGIRLQSCGYHGGSGSDAGTCGALTSKGQVLIGGFTQSADMPFLGAGSSRTPSGGADGFLAILATSFMEFSTVFGWTGNDVPMSLVPDANGDVFLAGSSTSEITMGTDPAGRASDRVQSTSTDAMIVKWAFGTLALRNPTDGTSLCGGASVGISWLAQDLPTTERYTVDVSGDNGQSWTEVTADIPLKNTTWTVPTTAPDSGTYVIRVRTARGHVAVSGALPVGLAPDLQKQPASAWVCPGNGQDLFVEAAGEGLRYQWYKDGVAISGATSSSLVIASASESDAGMYTVVVSNDCQNVTSEAASITVAPAPAITQQPASASFDAGATIELMVTADGPGLGYQWYHNNQPIAAPAGTQARLQIPNATVDHQGSYHCMITSDCGEATSSTAMVSILTSVDEDALSGSIVLAPQPAGDDLTITLANGMGITSVVISDLLGTVVFQRTVDGDVALRLPVSAIASGTYAITVISLDRTFLRPLVIQR